MNVVGVLGVLSRVEDGIGNDEEPRGEGGDYIKGESSVLLKHSVLDSRVTSFVSLSRTEGGFTFSFKDS